MVMQIKLVVIAGDVASQNFAYAISPRKTVILRRNLVKTKVMSNFGRQTRYIMGDVQIVDCKTVRIFAYSSKREQSNKRSGTRLKTESETGERQFFSLARVRLVRHALPISLLILRKKPTVLQSMQIAN